MRTHRTWPLTLGLLASLALLAGCAVPLGPGYHIRHETVTVRYQPGIPGLHYSLSAVVRNVGNRPLDSLKIQVPRRPSRGRQEPAQSTAEGTTVSRPAGRYMRLPIPLKPPLERKKSRELRFDYVVLPPSKGMLFEPDEWFPTFVQPHGLFAKGEPLARKTKLRIIVPSGFRAIAGGRLRGVRAGRSGGETEYRYQTQSSSLPPFLVIGRFVRRKIHSGKTDVVFWTRRPLAAACTESLAAHLAATDALYRSSFGSTRWRRRPIPVIEAPVGKGATIPGRNGGFGSVPGGLWFSVAPSRLCAQPRRFFPAADEALAANWFGWTIAAEADARAFLDGGARRYAAFVAEQSEGPASAQARRVSAWLEQYARLGTRAKPIAPAALGGDSSAAQRQMAGIQSALFLIALQDRFGRAPVEKALAHLVRSLRNSTTGLDDARSALEQATGRNLFDLFNQWQERAGIPAGFRKRYGKANGKTAENRGSNSNSRRVR